jgi:general secretion pathway protein E
VVASERGIREAIERWYGPAQEGGLPGASTELRAPAAPVVQVLERLLSEALARQTQGLLLEPAGASAQVSWWMDGVRQPGAPLAEGLYVPMLTRLKALARLDITQHHQAQEGEGHVQVGELSVALHVAITPGPAGEQVTLRLQNLVRPVPTLEQLGMEAALRGVLGPLLQQPQGLLLVLCPDEEARATVLASLQACAAKQGGQVSLSTPHQLAKASAGFTLCGLPAKEVAEALQQLERAGFSPTRLSPLLSGCLTARLVRRLCAPCALAYQPGPALAQRLPLAEGIALYRAQGCPTCFQTGYHGHIGLFLWQPGAALPASAAFGLREAAIQAVRAGLTAVEEIARVLPGLLDQESGR